MLLLVLWYLESLQSGDEAEIERSWLVLKQDWQELHRMRDVRARKFEEPDDEESEPEPEAEGFGKLTKMFAQAGGPNAAIPSREN